MTVDAYVDVRIWIGWIFPVWGARLNLKELDISAFMDARDLHGIFPQMDIKLNLEATKFDFDLWIVGWIVKLFISP